MWPDLKRTKDNPMGSRDVGNGYLLLAPRDTSRYDPLPAEQAAIEGFLASYPGADRNDRHVTDIEGVYRWGRLKIPTGQVARS